MTGLADDLEDLVDGVVLDSEDHGRVRLLEEASRAREAGRPEFAIQQRVDEGPRVLVVNDRDDELHAASIGTAEPPSERCTMRRPSARERASARPEPDPREETARARPA